jgi:polyhydroxyalkanoate synthase
MPIRINGVELGQELARLQEQWQRALPRIAERQPVPVGTSARELAARWDNVRLYHYRGTASAANKFPVLVVYSLVNRPYILDLKPERSLLGALRDGGAETYLLDWGYPESVDQFLTLDDYVAGYLDDAVETLCRRHGVDRVHLVGICQGGTLATCYAALYPERVQSLITLVSPIDFHAGNSTLHHLAKHIDFDGLPDGNVCATLLNAVFVSLKPYRLLSQRYLEMISIAEDDEALDDFLRMEQWMYDSPDQAGAAFRQFGKAFYQRNGLIRGEIELDGRRVDLARIGMPVYNVYASADHLVPPASAAALNQHIRSSDQKAVEFPAGHLGVFISGRAHKTLFPRFVEWLRERDGAA